MVDFVGFPKIPRYSRWCICTEKIDGTSGQIFIMPIGESGTAQAILFGSRSRWITPENDNHGFAAWGTEHAKELFKLGPGHHFGEWWGRGINRGYGLKEKRFSLFNLKKWSDPEVRPKCCGVVPTLWVGDFPPPVEEILETLKVNGSTAAPGFPNPEGIVIYHVQGNILFKKTLKNDEGGKDAGF